eukprot:m.78747 g.78747  ORF g.78747 m.78747 type:complete len:396 (+) comp19235_c0_seq4:192-1379(+)
MILLAIMTVALGAPESCTVNVLAQTSGCVQFNLSALPQLTYLRSDGYPESYLIAPPCGLADRSNCTACANAPPAGVYQLMPQTGCAGDRCIRCDGGSFTDPKIEGAALNVGINISYGGGDGGRQTTYSLICDKSVDAANGPDSIVLTDPAYRVVWRHPAACGQPAPIGTPGCTASKIPRPTPALLEWQAREIGALIHFNMMTFDKCGDPSLFQPDQLNTSQWVDSMVALGVKEAVLVAKHGCGFVLWPSKAKVPGGDLYNYSVAYSSWQDGKGDVLKDFLASCNERSIRTGTYYSLNSNNFAKTMGWTADELIAIEKQQMSELWGAEYGNHAVGGHAELWFDGRVGCDIPSYENSHISALNKTADIIGGYRWVRRRNSTLCERESGKVTAQCCGV